MLHEFHLLHVGLGERAAMALAMLSKIRIFRFHVDWYPSHIPTRTLLSPNTKDGARNRGDWFRWSRMQVQFPCDTYKLAHWVAVFLTSGYVHICPFNSRSTSLLMLPLKLVALGSLQTTSAVAEIARTMSAIAWHDSQAKRERCM